MSVLNKEKEQNNRKRAKNYTSEEEMLLVDLVEKHKNIIENKKSDAVIWKQKQAAWKKIEEEFSAISGTERNWKVLRDKYDCIKRKSKAEMAHEKMETYRTGGGVAAAKVSTVCDKVSAMLGDSATGLQNMFDSDSLTENVGTILEDSILENFTECADQDILHNDKLEQMSKEKKCDWSSWQPATLKQPKSKELVAGFNRKRCHEEEKMQLTILQQQFYKDENKRAQEKHEEELRSLKLKNQILEIELMEKKKKNE